MGGRGSVCDTETGNWEVGGVRTKKSLVGKREEQSKKDVEREGARR